MRVRFGERIRKLTAGTFLVLRALAEGVRVVAISLVVSIVLGAGKRRPSWRPVPHVVLHLRGRYDGRNLDGCGPDVPLRRGAALSLFVMLHEIPGGWKHVVDVAAPLGKFQVLDFRLARPLSFSREPTASGRGPGGVLPDHGQSRYRAIDGPTPAGRAERTREPQHCLPVGR